MLILAVDLGAARTGLALSDSSESFAFPKGVLFQRNRERLVEEIAAKAAELKAEQIVVGFPKNMDGSVGFKAKECAETADLIAAATGLPVVLQDERCTTVSAHTALNYDNVRGKKRKNVVDAVAATMILEDYLAAKKNRGEAREHG